MKIELFQAFNEYHEKGLRKQASKLLHAFISSFEGKEERKKWVWEYLSTLKKNRHSRIRHEIFHELLYPVLTVGYASNDFNSTLWLGKLSQNIYASKKLHEELGWISEQDLYRKCHEIDPENDEARLLLLQSIISWLEYTEHEWPSGILYGHHGATIEQCDDIRNEIQYVFRLDKEHQYSEFIKQYNKKLKQYRAKLSPHKSTETN